MSSVAEMLARAFGKTIDKEDVMDLFEREQHPRASALALSRQRYAFFEYAAAQIGIDQAALHLIDRHFKAGVV